MSIAATISTEIRGKEMKLVKIQIQKQNARKIGIKPYILFFSFSYPQRKTKTKTKLTLLSVLHGAL